MRRTVLGLCAVAGLGLTGYLLAGDLAGDKTTCGSASVAAKEGGCSGGCPIAAAMAENAHYKHANELLKSWHEAPTRLAAMTDNEKAEAEASFKKLAESHPMVPVFEPTMAYMHEGLATLTKIDAAAKQLCAQASAPTTRPAGDGVAAADASVALAKAEGQMCPKTAAAMASATMKMKQSAALTAKANELMLVAYQAAHQGEGGQKGECCKSGTTAALTSGEEKPAGGCCGSAKSEAKLTAATEKKAGGCCGGGEAKTTAALTAGEDKSAGAKEGGCCSGAKATTAAMASTENKPCVKTLVSHSQQFVADSGQLLAQWQGANIRLASMEAADREATVKLASTVMASCPIGSRMPDTMETVGSLLRDAAALQAQAMAEVCHNANLSKMVPEASKELARTRLQVLSAMINVIEKSGSAMRPAAQVASAQ
jgi:hypothetical protein